jgi:arylsulfatase A-like enzyme
VSLRARFNLISILGVLFLVLVFHNVAAFRMRIILGHESLGYVVSRLPGNPTLVVIAGAVLVVLLVAVVGAINRRLSSPSVLGRGRLLTIPLALAFVAAGGLMVWMNPRFPTPQEWSGFAAAVVGVSLLLLAMFTSRRALATGHVILVVAAVVALLLPQLVPGHRAKTKVIRGFIETADGQLDQKRQSWTLANPEEILADAGQRASRHQVYRFDERLQDITEIEAPAIDDGQGVLFAIPQDGVFVPANHQGAASETSGSTQVVSDYRGGTVLRTEKPLRLDWSQVGAFYITMKVSRGSYFQVFWGDSIGKGTNGIRIPLAPPGESASYVIKEKIIRHRGEGEVSYIWIIPSDQNARVEIESFQVLDRIHAVLRGAPFGAGYDNVDDEVRRVLFVSTPCRLTYRVQVPASAPRLLFGLTTADGSIPTTFSVTVVDAGRERRVFATVWEDDAHWSDHEVDLSAWAGKTVDIGFETAAPVRNLGLWSNPVMLGESFPAPNVVIYLVDCLRADHLGAYGYERNTSPFFDDFSARGVLFERAYANGPHTKLSIPSLFSSNPVAATGVRHPPDVLPEAFPTLAEILRAMGYVTGAFTTNGNAGPFSGTHQGFSALFDGKRILREAGPDYTDTDAEVLIGDFMNDWIRRNKSRNFFLYVHTMDAHGVYDPPAEYRHYFDELESQTPVARNRIFDPPWIDTPTREGRMALYDGEIAYGDVHFGRFVGMLEDAGVLDNTIIVFLADHGEYFGEHRMWGHVAPCFKQGTHIPLLIVGPGFPGDTRIDKNVQILDVMPTILDAVGFDPDPVLFQGESLVPLARGESADVFDTRLICVDGGFPAEMAFYCGDYHVLPEKNIIFDLSQDPDEEVYLNEFLLDYRLKAMARGLSEKYTRTYADLTAIMTPAGGDALEVDPETLKQLRALGYIQ